MYTPLGDGRGPLRIKILKIVADRRVLRVQIAQSSKRSRIVRPYGSLPTPVTVATTARERRLTIHTVPLGGVGVQSRSAGDHYVVAVRHHCSPPALH
jgi:hypothetical protein